MARQLGLLTYDQARASGMSASAIQRRIALGVWKSLFPRVYRDAVAPESWRQRVLGACLWGGDGTVASHETAAALWSLDTFERSERVAVTRRFELSAREPDIEVHRTRRLDPWDIRQLGPIPVTTVERTLVDLAARFDQGRLELVTESAVRMGYTNPERLWKRIQDLHGRHGLSKLRAILRSHTQLGATQSEWEARLLALILDHGLPEPVLQCPVWDGETWRRADLAYPEASLIIEYDSYTWHSARRPWERGHTRTAGLTAEGLRVLPVSMDDVDLHPRRTLTRIEKLLRLGGMDLDGLDLGETG